MRLIRQIAYVIALPALLIALWWVWTRGGSSFWVPSPPDLARTFVEVWVGDRFVDDVLPSVTRLAVGVLAAIVLGVALGVAIGLNRWLRRTTEPVFELFRAIPPPVLVPILMVLVGVNSTMQVAVIISGCVWPVLLNTIEGVRATDSVLSDTARAYGLRGAARLRRLTLPAASPAIMAGVRQCLSLGLILMVISEMFASSSGLGFTIVQFQRSFSVPEMWSGILLLGLLGLLLAGLFVIAEKRVLGWYHGLKEVERSE